MHLDPKLRQSVRHFSIRIVMKVNFLDIGRLANAIVSQSININLGYKFLQIKSVCVFTFVAILLTSNGPCTVLVLATRK